MDDQNEFNNVLQKLIKIFPEINFKSGESFYWSPKNKTVYYQSTDNQPIRCWTLIHETCHGLLNHKTYRSDFELVSMELQAWDKAKYLADDLSISIDQNHVEDCLDSYRNWQYKRSLCPTCDLGGIQISVDRYSCIFCENSWKVSAERFCRPYRISSSLVQGDI